MRNGFILLHRQGLTQEEWKHPLRTLAWIDLLTMAAWEDFTNDEGVFLKRGELIASMSFLEDRWRQNRGTVHRWLTYWEKEGMAQRVTQHPSQQLPQRLFLVNYAKYQDVPQRVPQQLPQRVPQPMKENSNNKRKKEDDVRPETKSLVEYIDTLCQELGMTAKVNIVLLNELVARYKGPPLRGEVRKCMAWMVDHGKREITTLRLTNWLAKAGEIAKRDENKRLEWQQTQKDPALAARLKASGEKKPDNIPTTEQFAIDPSLRSKLLSPPNNA